MILHNNAENEQLETAKTDYCREIIVLLNIEDEMKSIETFLERHDEIKNEVKKHRSLYKH